jgi:hypothetical protein
MRPDCATGCRSYDTCRRGLYDVNCSKIQRRAAPMPRVVETVSDSVARVPKPARRVTVARRRSSETADTIALKRTLPSLNFPDGDANPDLDPNRIHFVGSSLGSIISGVFLGLDTDIEVVTLQSPAGPWTSILTDPQAIDFGQPIRNALAAQGLPFGTIGFDNFVRDLQTVIDPVDPVNYSIDAAASHSIHVIEVLGDTAVPNGPTDYIAQLWGLPSVSTTTITAPPATVEGIVRFKGGVHSSLFNPTPNPAVTAEMQQQTVFYAASGGSAIRIQNASVVQ